MAKSIFRACGFFNQIPNEPALLEADHLIGSSKAFQAVFCDGGVAGIQIDQIPVAQVDGDIHGFGELSLICDDMDVYRVGVEQVFGQMLGIAHIILGNADQVIQVMLDGVVRHQTFQLCSDRVGGGAAENGGIRSGFPEYAQEQQGEADRGHMLLRLHPFQNVVKRIEIAEQDDASVVAVIACHNQSFALRHGKKVHAEISGLVKHEGCEDEYGRSYKAPSRELFYMGCYGGQQDEQ